MPGHLVGSTEAGLNTTVTSSLECILGGWACSLWAHAPLLGGVVSAGAWPQPVCGLAGPGLTWGHRPLTTLFALQPFRCAHCHYSCNISGSLKRHYNRKHPNEEYANVGAGELAADALVQQGK